MASAMSLWEFFSRDVSFLGGPSSPMVSWLGALGILLMFLWQVLKLRREVTFVQRGYDRVQSMLGPLVQERGDVEQERFTQQVATPSHNPVSHGVDSTLRRDRDDLLRLDAEMNKEPMFRGPWTQYRLTLILEQVPWFLEPRLFSSRRAEEVLPQEALIGRRINLHFYQQFPSLLTGIGLLLTFLALFIGLGKLHAEGSEIIGIQGLINGLAGKFLTSIVGLMLANVFTLIEKPMVSRLQGAHHTFLGFVDQLFPRKTVEQMLEQLTSMHGLQQSEQTAPSQTRGPSASGAAMTGLTESIAGLTSNIQSLKKLQETAHEDSRRTMADFQEMMRNEVQTSIHELHEAIRALTVGLADPSHHMTHKVPTYPSRPFLWDASPGSQISSGRTASESSKSWLRWPRFTQPRRTG